MQTFRALRARGGLRVVHYAVMTNHIHAIVEADDAPQLDVGMRALTVRLALRLNALLARRGPVFDHRYHARALTSPHEVRTSLQYVLLNARKHAAESGRLLPARWIDRRTTAVCFDGWQSPPPVSCAGDFGISAATTWLLRVGWRRHGLLRLDAVPGRRKFDSAMVRAAA